MSLSCDVSNVFHDWEDLGMEMNTTDANYSSHCSIAGNTPVMETWLVTSDFCVCMCSSEDEAWASHTLGKDSNTEPVLNPILLVILTFIP
jgi:hypothetical protein